MVFKVDRIGIGVSNPSQNLDVNGGCKFTGPNIYLDWHNDQRVISTADNNYRQGYHFQADTRIMRLFSTTGEGDSGGAIAFSTRVGAGSSDTDYGTERMRIDSSGNVGIGTSSPACRLDIAGEDVMIRGNTPSINFSEGTSAMDGSFRIRYDGANVSNNDNFLAVQTGSNFAVTSLHMTYDGNVGIGTTSPDEKLEVRGDVKFSYSNSEAMHIDSGGTIRRQWYDSSSNSNQGSGFHFTASAIWPTNNAGTYNNGDITFGHTDYRWCMVYTKDVNAEGGIIYCNPKTTTVNSPTSTGIDVKNTESGDATITLRVKDSNAGDPFISFDVTQDYGWSMGIDNSDSNKFKLARKWHDLSDSTALTVSTGGNLGIGTTSPQEKFHLYGSPMIQHETRYDAGGTSGWYKIGTWDATSTGGARLKISLLGSEGYSAGGVDRGGETIIYASMNNNSPTNVSNMSGSIHAHGRSVITQAKFKQYGSDRYKYEIIVYVETYTRHSMKIECTETTTFTRAWTSASDPGSNSATVQAALFTHVVTNDGNVGINDTTPGYKLSVNGSFRVHGNTSTFGSDGLLHINSRSTQYGSETVALQTTIDDRALTDSNPGTYGSESRNVLALQPDGGYVGVGTTSPGYRLHVDGTSMFTDGMNIIRDTGYAALEMSGPDGAYIDLKNPSTDDYDFRIITTGSGGSIQVASGGDVMNFASSGNIGINDSSPSYRLSVGGDIYATGNITAYSDIRAKSNIEKIKNPLEKINKISGYTYTMKTEDNLDKRYTGLIAQEVLEILPEAVAGSEETQYSLAYGNMVGILVEAIKELKLEIDELKRSR